MATLKARRGRRPGKPTRAPEVPSPAQRRIFFLQFAESLSLYDARIAAKITRDQLKALMEKDPEFAKEMQEIKDDNLDRVEDAAFRQAVTRGDKDMIKLLLQSKRTEEYGAKAQVTIKVDVSKLSDDELADLIARHSAKK